MLLAAVRSLVLANTNVTDITSKCYPVSLPQGETIPAIDMRVVTTTNKHYLGGTLKLYSSNVTLDCYAYEVKTADDIAMAILEPVVVDFRGTQDSVHIRGIHVTSGISHSIEEADPGSDRIRYVSSVTLEVVWSHG